VNEKGATVRIEERYREAWVQSRLTVQDYEEFLRSLPGAWQHDIEQINRLEAENERLREALERISHPDPDSAPFLSWNDAEEIAREALRVDDNPDTKGGY
jgi:hypothetical protein